jgi:hypothetical protein
MAAEISEVLQGTRFNATATDVHPGTPLNQDQIIREAGCVRYSCASGHPAKFLSEDFRSHKDPRAPPHGRADEFSMKGEFQHEGYWLN